MNEAEQRYGGRRIPHGFMKAICDASQPVPADDVLGILEGGEIMAP